MNIVHLNYQGDAIKFNTDGWINATEIAKREGKRLDHWLKTEETKGYIAALARNLNTPNKGDLIRTNRGRHNGGTWLHPKLAVAFARWLSADFAVWCDLQIDVLIRQGIEVKGHEYLLSLLVRPEAMEWERRFQPDFYHALAKVTKTKYDGHAKGTPFVYARLTRKWVYGAIMPKDVLAEIDARRGDSDKLHQWLTEGGAKVLEGHISKVTTIAESSIDLKDFESRCMRAFPVSGQLRIVYPSAA